MNKKLEEVDTDKKRKALISLIEKIAEPKIVDYLYKFSKEFVKYYDNALYMIWKNEIRGD